MHLSQRKKVKLLCETSVLSLSIRIYRNVGKILCDSLYGQMGKGQQSDANYHIFMRKGRKIIKRQRTVHKGHHTTVISKIEENQSD